MEREPLIDGHGRTIEDLRVSVTDRCNFRCQYCMPAEGLPWLERDEVLRFEEIARLVAVTEAEVREAAATIFRGPPTLTLLGPAAGVPRHADIRRQLAA